MAQCATTVCGGFYSASAHDCQKCGECYFSFNPFNFGNKQGWGGLNGQYCDFIQNGYYANLRNWFNYLEYWLNRFRQAGISCQDIHNYLLDQYLNPIIDQINNVNAYMRNVYWCDCYTDSQFYGASHESC